MADFREELRVQMYKDNPNLYNVCWAKYDLSSDEDSPIVVDFDPTATYEEAIHKLADFLETVDKALDAIIKLHTEGKLYLVDEY